MLSPELVSHMNTSNYLSIYSVRSYIPPPPSTSNGILNHFILFSGAYWSSCLYISISPPLWLPPILHLLQLTPFLHSAHTLSLQMPLSLWLILINSPRLSLCLYRWVENAYIVHLFCSRFPASTTLLPLYSTVHNRSPTTLLYYFLQIPEDIWISPSFYVLFCYFCI